MNFETIERCGRVHVVKNGVESEGNAILKSGWWRVFFPTLAHIVETQDEALTLIAEQMDTWYTIHQAAARLVELNAFDIAPSTQMMGIWCREGRFPGAVKVRGKGCRGSGGAWRIPAAPLAAFVEWRMGR